jgi:hypothetical protein
VLGWTGYRDRKGTAVKVTLAGIVVGAGLYWAFQHFTGKGNTGKSRG